MPDSRSSWTKMALITLLAIFVVGTAFFIWNTVRHADTFSGDAIPAGTLYLSMVPRTASSSVLYSFGIASKALTPVSMTKSGSAWSPSITPDGLVYVSNQTASGTLAAASQLFSLNSSGGETQLSDTATPWKRSPRYSTALNQYVYEGRKIIVPGQVNAPSNSSVYLLTGKQQGKFITAGSMPSLTPDGKSVVVLRNDGLYMTSLVATSTAEKIWGLDSGKAGLQDHFSISPDGKQIAWTIPDKGHIYIMQIDSWAPFSGRVTNDIATTALWPQFSPNSDYLAYVAIDLASSTPSNARLVAQSLTTGIPQTLQSLSGFDAQSLFLSEWGE